MCNGPVTSVMCLTSFSIPYQHAQSIYTQLYLILVCSPFSLRPDQVAWRWRPCCKMACCCPASALPEMPLPRPWGSRAGAHVWPLPLHPCNCGRGGGLGGCSGLAATGVISRRRGGCVGRGARCAPPRAALCCWGSPVNLHL